MMHTFEEHNHPPISILSPGFPSVLKTLLEQPVAHHLNPAAETFLDAGTFPEVQDYNSPHFSLVSGSGVPVRFMPEPKRMHREGFKRLYQPRIFLTGEVSARPNHWHDFFDMLIWRSFPKTKAALNRRHFFAFDEVSEFPWVAPPHFRTPEQDALTIFDEGGMVVLYPDSELWQEGRALKFSPAFLSEHKDDFCFLVFGHAIFEELVKGHISAVASAIGVPLNPDAFYGNKRSTLPELLRLADVGAAAVIADRTQPLLTKNFSPVALRPLWKKS